VISKQVGSLRRHWGVGVVEILTGEFLIGLIVAAVLVWGYSLFLLVAPPDTRPCAGGATAESSGLELRPLGIGDSNARPCQGGFELTQTPVPPLEFVDTDLGGGEALEDGFQGDRHQSGMSCACGTVAS
jgi:hypothetical protein